MATNLTSIQILEKSAIDSLTTQAIANLFWIILGSIGVLTNCLTLVTIRKTKTLRNKSQYAVCSHALASAFNSLATLTLGARRYILYLIAQPGFLTQIPCAALQLFFEFTGNTTVFALLALGIDRFVAVFAPMFYKVMPVSKHVSLFNLVCFGLPVVSIVTAFLSITDPTALVPICQYATAFGPQYINWRSVISIVITVVTTAIYVIAMAKVGYGYWGQKWLNEAQRTEWARKVQLSAFVSISAIFFVYILIYASNTVVRNLYAWKMLPIVWSPYTGLIVIVDNLLHFFVYLRTNRKFRKAFFNIIRRTPPNSVGTGSRT